MMKHLPLLFWLLLPLLSLRLSPRLMLIPTFCTEDTDMAWDILDILDTMDTPMPMLTLARDLLMLNLRLRLRLTLPYFTAPMAMVLDTMAMLGWDTMDTPMHTTDLLTTESVPLMLSLRPRLMRSLPSLWRIWSRTPWIPWILWIPLSIILIRVLIRISVCDLDVELNISICAGAYRKGSVRPNIFTCFELKSTKVRLVSI